MGAVNVLCRILGTLSQFETLDFSHVSFVNVNRAFRTRSPGMRARRGGQNLVSGDAIVISPASVPASINLHSPVPDQTIFRSRRLPRARAECCAARVNVLRGNAIWKCGQALSLPGLWLTLGLPFLAAQSVPTVREAEFRSRWVDLRVDRPREEVLPEKREHAVEPESVPRMVAAISSFFRNSPVDLRGGLSAGWEYSNEYSNFQPDRNASNSSFFVAPVIAAFYDRDIGPWTISGRYSAGYVYYFDEDYYPGSGANNLPSQTAGLDVRLERARLRVQSNAAGSYGSGFDIERGDQTERLAVSENLSAEYQVTEYLRAGVGGSAAYEHYSGESRGFDDRHTRLAGTVFGDYFWTGKTRLRLELGTGSETQDNGTSSVLERTYVQALLRAYIQWSEKVSIEAGAGLALFDESGLEGANEEGLRPVYQLSIAYTPTEKTSVRIFAGREATSVAPNLSLLLNWRPRLNTNVTLSIYQEASLSTVASGQDRIAQGALLRFGQRVFQRIDAGLGGGIEQEEYRAVGDQQSLSSGDPYYFVFTSLAWEVNRWLLLQGRWQISSRQDFGQTAGDGLRTRASLSFRLTF
jgi:hypothetical protein